MDRLAFRLFALLFAVALAGSWPCIQAQEKDDEADLATAKARKELFEELDKFYEAKKGDVAKAAPEAVRAVKRFLSKTSKDEEQFEVANLAVRLLEAKGQYDAARNLLADLKKHYEDADRALARAAVKAHESAEKRLAIIGKPLTLEGKLVDGSKFDWSKYKGKIVLVDFWATWCKPCLAELPNVKRNYTKYKDKGFEVVGISLDDDTDALKDFIRTEKIAWQNITPGDSLAERFGVEGIPFTILVNRDGKVVGINIRGEELGERLEGLIPDKGAKE